ncbi:transcription-associated protein 1 [Gurleya vavrai]
MNTIFDQTLPLEARIQHLDKWCMSTEALENIYQNPQFTNNFINLVLNTLETFPPQKNFFNLNRNIILRILNRIKTKDNPQIPKLYVYLVQTIREDYIENVHLAAKSILSLTKKLKLDELQLQSLLDAFSIILEDVINSFNGGNEQVILTYLFVYAEIMPFLTILMRIYKVYGQKFEKIIRELHTFVHLFMSNNDYHFIINNNETITAELINFLFRITKFFVEVTMNLNKDHQVKNAVPEISMFIMNFCPEEAETMKKEIFQQVCMYCIQQRDVFHNYVDIILSDSVLFRSNLRGLKNLGLTLATEISFFYREKITKETLHKISTNLCSAIENELALLNIEKNLENEKNQKKNLKENLKLFINVAIKLNDVFASQKYIFYDKHVFLMKNFYCMLKIYKSLGSFIKIGDDSEIPEFKLITNGCIRGFKNMLTYFASIKEPSQSTINSVKCFSHEEISKFSELFSYSIDYFSQNCFTAEDNYALEELCVIFIYLEEPSFLYILTNNISNLILKTKKNQILFIMWKFYLGIKSVIEYFIDLLLNNLFLGKIEKEDLNFYLIATDLIFKTLISFPKEADSILSGKIERILKILCTHEEELFYYYKILKIIFQYFIDCDVNYPFIYKNIVSNIENTIKNLGELTMLYPTEEILIEVLFVIPTNFIFVISNLQIFLEPLLYGLRNKQLVFSALEFLNLCFENLHFEFINEILGKRMHDLMIALLEATKNEGASDKALDVISKFKGDKYLEKYIVPTSFNYAIKNVNVTDGKTEYSCDSLVIKCIELLRGNFIDTSYGDYVLTEGDVKEFRLTSKNFIETDCNLSKSAFNIISSFIFSALNWGLFEKEGTIDRIAAHIKNIQEFGLPIDVQKQIQRNETLKYSHFARLKNISITKIFQAKQLVQDSVIAIFNCTNLPFKDDANELLKIIYTEVAVYKIIELYRLHEVNSKIYFDYSSFIDPLIECFSDDSILLCAENMMLHLYEKMLELCGCKKTLRETCFFQGILSKFISFCYYKNVSKRNAAINGIMFLLKNIDLEIEFVSEQRCQLIKALFFNAGNGSESLYTKAKDIIFYLFRKTFTLSNHDYGYDTDKKDPEEKNIRYGYISNNPDIVYQLLVGLKSTFAHVRILSQSSLEYLAELRNLDVTELIQPYKDVILDKFFVNSTEQKDSMVMAALLDGLTYIISLRPPLFTSNEDLDNLANFLLEKFEINHELRITSKTTKFAPCYLKFLLAFLNLSKRSKTSEKILFLFLKGLFIGKELTEICSKGLKQALLSQNEATREFLISNFKPTVNVFLKEKIDSNIINSMIIIMNIINSISKMEIIEKLSEIYRIRDENLLFKALEITSLLQPFLPEIFLTEIIDVCYYLEQRNKLLSIDKNQQFLKEICEKNLNILSFFIKRINDFCVFRIMMCLIKNSFSIRNYLFENALIIENIFSIIVFDKINYNFNSNHCLIAIKIYKDLKSRNRDMNYITKFLRKCNLNGENINVLYSIDETFVFLNPKEKFTVSGLTIESRKKLLENYIKIVENEKNNNDTLLNNQLNTNQILNINDMDQIDSFFYGTLENIAETNIDFDFKGKIILLFYIKKVFSKKIINQCYNYITRNNNMKFKSLLYLTVFDPKENIFESLISAHFEFKDYIKQGLKNLVLNFGPDIFEKPIIKIMRNQIAYKNHLYIIYPLLIEMPQLITINVAHEIFDVICRLFGTMVVLHQKTGMNLLEKVYFKYKDLKEMNEIQNGLSICYTLLFSNYCHSKEEISFAKINQFNIPLNFSFLFFVDESLVNITLSNMIDNELNKNCDDFLSKNTSPNDMIKENGDEITPDITKNIKEVHYFYELEDMVAIQNSDVEYKIKVGLHLNNYIRRCFNDLCIKESFLKFMDIAFLLQILNRYFVNQQNPKTTFMIFMHLIKIKKITGKNNLPNASFFDMFIHLVNAFLNVNIQYARDLIKSFLEVASKIEHNFQILKFLLDILRTEIFEDTEFIVLNSFFILEDKNISLGDKIAFVKMFKFTEIENLNFVLSFFNEKPALRHILQKPFLCGTKANNKKLQKEFYITINETISKNLFTRIRYLLNFDWSLYGDKWLYIFFRMCHYCLNEITFETFKLYVYGDDTFYENIYTDDVQIDIKKFKPKIDAEKFINNNIKSFNKKVKKFKSENLSDDLYSVLFAEFDTLCQIFPGFFVQILKNLTEEEILIILDDFLRLNAKKQISDNFKPFFQAFELFIDYLQNDSETIFMFDMLEIDYNKSNKNKKGDSMGLAFEIKSKFSNIRLINNLKNSSSLLSLINIVDDKGKTEIYSILQENEFYYGTLKSICKFNETLIALNLQLNNNMTEAIKLYFDLQKKAKNNELCFDKNEYQILENEWIECAKSLQKWEVLIDIGSFVGDCKLISEATFRNSCLLLENERSNMLGFLNLRKKTPETRFYELFLELLTLNKNETGNNAQKDFSVRDFNNNNGKNTFNHKNDFLNNKKPLNRNDLNQNFKNNQYNITKKEADLLQKLKDLKKEYIINLHSYPLNTKFTYENLIYIKLIDEMIFIVSSSFETIHTKTFDLISNFESLKNWDIFFTFRSHIFDFLTKKEPIKKFFHEKAKCFNALAKKCKKEKFYDLSYTLLQKNFFYLVLKPLMHTKKFQGK